VNCAVLAETAAQLIADGKGLLAIDESNATCNRRFAALEIAQTEESRRRWRKFTLADDILVSPRDPAAGASNRGWAGCECSVSSGIAVVPCRLQSGGLAWPLRRCDRRPW
jgi:hypothetical protein